MQTIRFHKYGEPADVLVLDEAEIPSPGADRIRVRVHACGLNPADWALCRGLFATELPRGIGLDVSGVVDAVGEGVSDIKVGDLAFGAADYSGYQSAGASEHAILAHWAPVPDGLDLSHAAALPMAIETAYRSIDLLDVAAGQTVLVYGAGSMMGFAGAQMALMRGARVIAAAGTAFAGALEGMGATVTPYGDGLAERVLAITGGRAPDLIFDAGPISGMLPELVQIAGGDGARIVTISNHGDAAAALGVRNSFSALRWEMLGPFGNLAAEGRFRIPIARSFAFADWREALALSLAGRAHGKLMLVPPNARV